MSLTKSENYSETFRHDLGRLLETGDFADARLVCFERNSDGNGEERKRVEIPVHRSILAEQSQFFADQFDGGRDEIEIQDFSPAVIRALLSAVYTQNFPVDEQSDLQSYEVAERYGLLDNIFEYFQEDQWKITVDDFPTKKRPGPMVFSGVKSAYGDNCEIQMKMRKDEKTGKYRIQMNFMMQCEHTLATDLSLSVLNAAGDKLKSVKREELFCESTVWENCLAYNQIVNMGKKKINSSKRWVKRNGTKRRHRKFVVLCEATLIYAREFDLNAKFGKLFKTGAFSDACIVFLNENGEKEVIPVHKVILAAGSRFFSVAFSIGLREAKMGEVPVHPELGLSPGTIRAMLSYIYTGTIPSGLKEPALIELFRAANFYQIDALVFTCAQLFRLTVENCAAFLQLADSHLCKILTPKALEFLQGNSIGVKQTVGWRRLMESDNRELKALCGHWLGKTPVTLETYTELLRIFDVYKIGELDGKVFGHWELLWRALAFIRDNERAIQESEEWRKKSKSEGRDVAPKTHYARYLRELPLTVAYSIDLFRLADDFGDENLKESALTFARGNRQRVKATEGWRRLREAKDPKADRLRAEMKKFFDEQK